MTQDTFSGIVLPWFSGKFRFCTARFSVWCCVALFFFVSIFPLCGAEQPVLSIPGLCYHQVLPRVSGRFTVSTGAFRAQLNLLKSHGYVALSSDDFLQVLAGTQIPRGKPVLLTFDDGYRSVYDYAFPLMQEFGFIGILCIYPRFIGSGNALSWDQIKTLQAAGWSVECHSETHANLVKTPADPVARQAFYEREIVGANQKIATHLGGQPCSFFVWPYGAYSEEAEALVKASGYRGAMTVDGGANYPGLSPFRVKRQVIYDSDSLEKFQIRLMMAALPVIEHSPAPGSRLGELHQISCQLPTVHDYSTATHVLNVKVNGGRLDFSFDQTKQRLDATVKNTLASGHRFIDIYLRDKRTGITQQHGWLVTLEKNSTP